MGTDDDILRMRLHGLRKGFATSLTRRGVEQSLIALIGRWRLQGAIHSYILHKQMDMLPITRTLWYGQKFTNVLIDYDLEERKVFDKIVNTYKNENKSQLIRCNMLR